MKPLSNILLLMVGAAALTAAAEPPAGRWRLRWAERWAAARRAVGGRPPSGAADPVDDPDDAPDADDPSDGRLRFWEPAAAARLALFAPATVSVGRPFDVIVTVGPPGAEGSAVPVPLPGEPPADGASPAPDEEAAPSPTLDPAALVRALAAAGITAGPAAGVAYRVTVEAPGCAVRPPFQTARVVAGAPPPALTFRLTAAQPGVVSVHAAAYHGLLAVGGARLRLEALAGGNGPAELRAAAAPLVAPPPGRPEHVLALAIAELYGPEAFQRLCEALDVDFVALPGHSRFARAADLVRACARRGRLEALADRVAADRPDWAAELRRQPRARRHLGAA